GRPCAEAFETGGWAAARRSRCCGPQPATATPAADTAAARSAARLPYLCGAVPGSSAGWLIAGDVIHLAPHLPGNPGKPQAAASSPAAAPPAPLTSAGRHQPAPPGRRQPMCGYRCSVGGTNVSLMVRGDTHRARFSQEPALSFVPDARAPPNGCCPTTAPVGLSLM